MTDISLYTPLKKIVAMFLDENNLNHDEMDKAWIIAFRGLVLLNQSIAAEPKTVRIPVSANKTVQWPVDCLSWVKVGVLNSTGEVSTLKINNALTTYKDTDPSRLSDLTADIASTAPLLIGSPYYYNYNYNGQYQTLFGVGGGLIQYGECRMDSKNRLVVLNPEFRYDSIIFEYLSSPQNDNDYEIQIVLQEALISFLNWKFKLGTRQDFYAAATEGRRSLPKKKVTLQELAQTIRETNGQYLKS